MKERLRYFDILKGIAIFMVVMGHVLAMGVRGIDSAPLFKFIGQIHMPLFFFISGWLAWRPKAPTLLPKAKRLLLPMIAVSTLWIFYFPTTGIESPFDSTFDGLWGDTFKNGYWFTLVLFEIFVLYVPVWHMFRRCNGIAAELCVVAVAWGILLAVKALLPPAAAGWLSYDLTAEFFAVFMAGVLASRHREGFGRLCANGNAVAAAIVVGVVCMEFVCWPWRHGLAEGYLVLGLRVVLQLAIALVGIAVVKPWALRAFADGTGTCAARAWEYIGSRSLSIYLLHYFFIFPMGCVRQALVAVNLSFVPLLVFSAAVAAAIVAVVLVLDYIFSYAGPLALLLTGSEPKKTPITKQ